MDNKNGFQFGWKATPTTFLGIEEEEEIEGLCRLGFDPTQISDLLGVGLRRVFYVMSVRNKMNDAKIESENITEEIIKLYNEGFTQFQIAEKLGRSQIIHFKLHCQHSFR